MNKVLAIAAAKQFRKDADNLLQRIKDHKKRIIAEKTLQDEKEFEDFGEFIAQHTLSQRDLESAIMRQGMALKYIGNPNPYPESYNPASPVVAPTADGLKL